MILASRLTPITRKENFLARAAGNDGFELKPITREEHFLARAAGDEGIVLDPITREEHFLQKIIDSGGGGYSLEDIASGAEPSGDLTFELSTFRRNAFTGCKNIRKVTLLSENDINGDLAFSPSSVTEVVALNTHAIKGSNFFNGCNKLEKLVVPKATYYENNMCNGCTALDVADIGGGSIMRGGIFTGCKALKTLIIRNNAVCKLGNVSNFNNTPFAMNGSGGTIYIPKVLYDRLGDGTALDYKTATNWATLDGYGTIAWAQIDGSIYENTYADGTPIT